MITCKQATDYISKKEEGKITLQQRYKLWQHLAVCSLCKMFSKQNKVITSSLSSHQFHEHNKLDQDDKDAFIKAMNEAGNNE